MADIGGVYHLSLSVRDIQKSVAWYKDLLGFQQIFETASTERGWIKIGLYHPASRTRLHFTQHRHGSDQPFSEFRSGLDHIAFRVPGGRVALEVWLARLAERGVDHSPIKKAAQGEVITFRDPDNIQLELYATAE
jgi:glyoxylase I family protein